MQLPKTYGEWTQEGEYRAKVEWVKKLHTREIKMNPAYYLGQEMSDRLQMITDLEEQQTQNRLMKTRLYWITVNPEYLEHDFHEFSNAVHKCVQKIWIKGYAYVYEVGPDDGSKNYHTHMIIETHKMKCISEVIREIYNTFKHLVGNVKHVHVRALPLEEYPRKLNYMKKVYYTKTRFQERNNLQELYTSRDYEILKKIDTIKLAKALKDNPDTTISELLCAESIDAPEEENLSKEEDQQEEDPNSS